MAKLILFFVVGMVVILWIADPVGQPTPVAVDDDHWWEVEPDGSPMPAAAAPGPVSEAALDSAWVSSGRYLRAVVSGLRKGDQVRCAAVTEDGSTLSVTRWQSVDPPVYEILIRVHDAGAAEGVRCWVR